AMDARLQAAVHLRFGLPAVLPVAVKKAIKQADKLSAWLEAVRIAGFAEGEADTLFGKPALGVLDGLDIHLRPPAAVRAAFVARHTALIAALEGASEPTTSAQAQGLAQDHHQSRAPCAAAGDTAGARGGATLLRDAAEDITGLIGMDVMGARPSMAQRVKVGEGKHDLAFLIKASPNYPAHGRS